MDLSNTHPHPRVIGTIDERLNNWLRAAAAHGVQEPVTVTSAGDGSAGAYAIASVRRGTLASPDRSEQHVADQAIMKESYRVIAGANASVEVNRELRTRDPMRLSVERTSPTSFGAGRIAERLGVGAPPPPRVDSLSMDYPVDGVLSHFPGSGSMSSASSGCEAPALHGGDFAEEGDDVTSRAVCDEIMRPGTMVSSGLSASPRASPRARPQSAGPAGREVSTTGGPSVINRYEERARRAVVSGNGPVRREALDDWRRGFETRNNQWLRRKDARVEASAKEKAEQERMSMLRDAPEATASRMRSERLYQSYVRRIGAEGTAVWDRLASRGDRAGSATVSPRDEDVQTTDAVRRPRSVPPARWKPSQLDPEASAWAKGRIRFDGGFDDAWRVADGPGGVAADSGTGMYPHPNVSAGQGMWPEWHASGDFEATDRRDMEGFHRLYGQACRTQDAKLAAFMSRPPKYEVPPESRKMYARFVDSLIRDFCDRVRRTHESTGRDPNMMDFFEFGSLLRACRLFAPRPPTINEDEMVTSQQQYLRARERKHQRKFEERGRMRRAIPLSSGSPQLSPVHRVDTSLSISDTGKSNGSSTSSSSQSRGMGSSGRRVVFQVGGGGRGQSPDRGSVSYSMHSAATTLSVVSSRSMTLHEETAADQRREQERLEKLCQLPSLRIFEEAVVLNHAWVYLVVSANASQSSHQEALDEYEKKKASSSEGGENGASESTFPTALLRLYNTQIRTYKLGAGVVSSSMHKSLPMKLIILFVRTVIRIIQGRAVYPQVSVLRAMLIEDVSGVDDATKRRVTLNPMEVKSILSLRRSDGWCGMSKLVSAFRELTAGRQSYTGHRRMVALDVKRRMQSGAVHGDGELGGSGDARGGQGMDLMAAFILEQEREDEELYLARIAFEEGRRRRRRARQLSARKDRELMKSQAEQHPELSAAFLKGSRTDIISARGRVLDKKRKLQLQDAMEREREDFFKPDTGSDAWARPGRVQRQAATARDQQSSRQYKAEQRAVKRARSVDAGRIHPSRAVWDQPTLRQDAEVNASLSMTAVAGAGQPGAPIRGGAPGSPESSRSLGSAAQRSRSVGPPARRADSYMEGRPDDAYVRGVQVRRKGVESAALKETPGAHTERARRDRMVMGGMRGRHVPNVLERLTTDFYPGSGKGSSGTPVLLSKSGLYAARDNSTLAVNREFQGHAAPARHAKPVHQNAPPGWVKFMTRMTLSHVTRISDDERRAAVARGQQPSTAAVSRRIGARAQEFLLTHETMRRSINRGAMERRGNGQLEAVVVEEERKRLRRKERLRPKSAGPRSRSMVKPASRRRSGKKRSSRSSSTTLMDPTSMSLLLTSGVEDIEAGVVRSLVERSRIGRTPRKATVAVSPQLRSQRRAAARASREPQCRERVAEVKRSSRSRSAGPAAGVPCRPTTAPGLWGAHGMQSEDGPAADMYMRPETRSASSLAGYGSGTEDNDHPPNVEGFQTALPGAMREAYHRSEECGSDGSNAPHMTSTMVGDMVGQHPAPELNPTGTSQGRSPKGRHGTSRAVLSPAPKKSILKRHDSSLQHPPHSTVLTDPGHIVRRRTSEQLVEGPLSCEAKRRRHSRLDKIVGASSTGRGGGERSRGRRSAYEEPEDSDDSGVLYGTPPTSGRAAAVGGLGNGAASPGSTEEDDAVLVIPVTLSTNDTRELVVYRWMGAHDAVRAFIADGQLELGHHLQCALVDHIQQAMLDVGLQPEGASVATVATTSDDPLARIRAGVGDDDGDGDAIGTDLIPDSPRISVGHGGLFEIAYTDKLFQITPGGSIP